MADEIRDRLSGALKDAMRQRNADAVSAYRSALSAIANAEAVEPDSGPGLRPRIGVGAADVARRNPSDAELIEILEAEVAEREDAAAEYERLGRMEQALTLRAQAAILVRFLRGS